jgi:hypothetical protein
MHTAVRSEKMVTISCALRKMGFVSAENLFAFLELAKC